MSNATIIEQAIKIGQEAEALLKGKEYFLGTVVSRFQAASERNPHDQSIRILEASLSSRLKKEGSVSVVSQKDIQDMYDAVSGLGKPDVFVDELGDLLLRNPVASVSSYNKVAGDQGRISGEMVEIGNPDEVSKLASVFNYEDPNKVARYIENGKFGIEVELESHGISKPKVAVADYNDKIAVYAVNLATPRGTVAFLVPTEIEVNKVLMPSIFVAGQDFQYLNKENLDSYIKNATPQTKVSSPRTVLATLSKFLTKESSDSADVSDFDSIRSFGNEYYVGKEDAFLEPDPVLDYKQAEVALPDSLKYLGDEILEETLVEAGLSFPREIVIRAKTILADELKYAKLHTDRIIIESEFENGLALATNIIGPAGRKKISVPMEVEAGRVLMPEYFMCGANSHRFSDAELKKVAAEQDDDSTFVPKLLDVYGLKYAEMHKLVLKKAACGDFVEATSLLETINQKYGEDLHRQSYQELMEMLKVGHTAESKPMSAIERFAEESVKKAESEDYQMSLTINPLLFYPKE